VNCIRSGTNGPRAGAWEFSYISALRVPIHTGPAVRKIRGWLLVSWHLAMSIHQLHPKGHPLTWQERLDEAEVESDVVGVARDYLATLTHEEVMCLPAHLRPGKIVDANDITTYAFDLVRHECQDDGVQRLVQRLAHVMSRASIRLSQIMVSEHAMPERRSNPSGGDRQQSA